MIVCPICDTEIEDKHIYGFCPNCGIALIRTNYQGLNRTTIQDKDDWIEGYFIGDGC